MKNYFLSSSNIIYLEFLYFEVYSLLCDTFCPFVLHLTLGRWLLPNSSPG